MSINPWVAPGNVRLPDFIIGGAMKSGTSTLHYLLSEHPHVYIPRNEVHFFDIDNILQHPDFNYFNGTSWLAQRLEDDPDMFWNWYSSHFEGAGENQIIGEDSTTYLASEVAAKRIGLQSKETKLIMMLRHPTARAYSQYWHMVRTGRAIYNFEDTIRFDPYSVLHKSLYRDQLMGLYRHIPKDRVKVVIFEEFIADMKEGVREICEYIDIDYELIPGNLGDFHKNKGAVPQYPAMQILKNKFFRGGGNLAYLSYLPKKAGVSMNKKEFKIQIHELLNRVHGKVNPLLDSNPYKIKPATREFLDDFFRKQLDGINDILCKDVMAIWFD